MTAMGEKLARTFNYLLIIVAVMAVMVVPAVAEVVLSEDFNDDAGELTGQKAKTGQVWADQTADWNTGTLLTGEDYGQGETVGAGYRETGSKSVWKGNVIPLGVAISDRICILGVDLQKDSGVVEACAALESADGRDGATLIWIGSRLKCGGNMWSGGINMGILTGAVRAELILHLDPKEPAKSTASLRYIEIDNPSNQGSVDLGTPGSVDPNGSGAFEFSTVALHVLKESESHAGYDNVSVVDNLSEVPELKPIFNKSKRLLLDSRVVEHTDNAVLRVGQVQKHLSNPLFGEDHPWEPRFDNLYPNVMYDHEQQLYKIWYFTWTYEPATSDTPREKRTPGIGAWSPYMKIRNASDFGSTALRDGLGYATSRDGIHWEKPLMDISPWRGQPSNLLIQPCHGAGVFKDARAKDPARRYKMFCQNHGMSVRFSQDGLNWGPHIPCPEIDAAGDTHNNALWVPELEKYVGFTRLWRNGSRVVGRTESADFTHWTTAEVVLRGKISFDVYSMPVFRYAGVYLGLPTIYREGVDRVHTELAWSPDTRHWQRIDAENPLVPNSETKGDYDWGIAYASFPIVKEREIRIYYGAGNAGHFDWRDGSLCLATLRKDGFAGYQPVDTARPAVVLTKPTILGRELALTADIQGGSITVAVLDEAGKVLLISQAVTNDVTDQPVSWMGGRALENLVGQLARLRFTIEGAKLYSFTL